jgi:hypothetical protein
MANSPAYVKLARKLLQMPDEISLEETNERVRETTEKNTSKAHSSRRFSLPKVDRSDSEGSDDGFKATRFRDRSVAPATAGGRARAGTVDTISATKVAGTRGRAVTIADHIEGMTIGYDPNFHLNSLQEGRRAMLSTLTIVDKDSKAGKIMNLSLLDLLRGIGDNIKSTIGGPAVPMIGRHGIGELKGRELCRLTKFGDASNALVYIVKQHCIIVSFRYDLRAVIESNRITFIAREGESDSLESIRSFMLGLSHYVLFVAE